MLPDMPLSHAELAQEMRKLCNARPARDDAVPFMTQEAVPVGVDPRTAPGYKECRGGALPVWRATVGFGAKLQRKRDELDEKRWRESALQAGLDEMLERQQELLALAS